MPKVKAYECSWCSTMMKPDERTRFRGVLRGKKEAEYSEDLCPDCAEKAVEGKATRPPRTRVLGSSEQRNSEPSPAGHGTRRTRPTKADSPA